MLIFLENLAGGTLIRVDSLIRHCIVTNCIYIIVESKEQMFKWPLDGVSVQAFFAISFQISWLNWF